MKLKYQLEVVEIENECVAVPVGDNASELSGVIKVNKSGAEILNLLHDDISEEDIVNILCERYENGKDEIIDMVKDFIILLKDKKLIAK